MNSYRSFHSDTAHAIEQRLVNDDVGCKADHVVNDVVGYRHAEH